MAAETKAATDLTFNELMTAHKIKLLRERLDPQKLHNK